MANDPEKPNEPLDPRTYFAAERTLLAWVRTGLALMGFGFVVARFGLFLRELATISNVLPHQRSTLSLWVGTTLVVLGVVVNVAAALKHWARIRRLEKGQPFRFSPWSLEMILAFLLAMIGLMMAIYLVFGLDHPN
jgi:putative membrane protein